MRLSAVRAPCERVNPTQPNHPPHHRPPSNSRNERERDPARDADRDRYASQTASTYASIERVVVEGGRRRQVGKAWGGRSCGDNDLDPVAARLHGQRRKTCPAPPHSAPRAPRRPPTSPAACRHRSSPWQKKKKNKAGAGVAGQSQSAIRPYLHLAPRRSRAGAPRDAPTTDLERRHVEGAAPGPGAPLLLLSWRTSSFSALSLSSRHFLRRMRGILFPPSQQVQVHERALRTGSRQARRARQLWRGVQPDGGGPRRT